MDFYYISPSGTKEHLSVPLDETVDYIIKNLEELYSKKVIVYSGQTELSDDKIFDVDMNNIDIEYLSRCQECKNVEDAIKNNHINCFRCSEADMSNEINGSPEYNGCICGAIYFLKSCHGTHTCKSNMFNNKARLSIMAIMYGNKEILEYICENVDGSLDIELSSLSFFPKLEKDFEDCLSIAIKNGLTIDKQWLYRDIIQEGYIEVLYNMVTRCIIDPYDLSYILFDYDIEEAVRYATKYDCLAALNERQADIENINLNDMDHMSWEFEYSHIF